VTPPDFGPQWTTPAPPPGNGGQRFRAGRVWAGIGLAILGHLLIIGLAVGLGLAGGGLGQSANWLVLGLVAQALLFVACLTFGIVLMVRGEKGIGLGLVIGWAAGVIGLPIIGFGACVVLLSGTGGR
jgi:hypothetical protein